MSMYMCKKDKDFFNEVRQTLIFLTIQCTPQIGNFVKGEKLSISNQYQERKLNGSTANRKMFGISKNQIKVFTFRQRKTYKVLINNSVTCCEESQYMRNEMSLIWLEWLPMQHVLRQVNLFSSPKWCLCLFIHLPNIMVHNRENNKPVRVIT